MSYNSGYLARELGLGVEGTLPSSPDFPLVLHGNQTREALETILGKAVIEEDLIAAVALAQQNENLDKFVKQTLAAGASYGAEQQQMRNQRRLAGAALGGAAGAAGIIALIKALQGKDKETETVLLQ